MPNPDIIATINGFQIESYNMNGLTYICVEDLRYYGFDVYYDNSTRTLSLNRNYNVNTIDPQNTNPNFWNIGSNNKRLNVLYTDIVTYADNNYVASSNVGGKTIINFNELSRFGTVNYDNSKREISLILWEVNSNPISYVAEFLQENIPYTSDWSIRVRAKGDVLMVTATTRIYANFSDIIHIKTNLVPADKADFSKFLDLLRSKGYAVSSFYVEYRNNNGSYITSFQIYD